MKKSVYMIVIALILVVASILPCFAGGHFRGGVWVGVGPGWWGPPYPYYYYPYRPYYVEPPVIIERESPVYVRPNRQRDEQDYWYYCKKPQGYYPYIKRCPSGWLKVVPSEPPDSGSRDSVPADLDERGAKHD
ncbi:MAG TPA: hypothetical protein VK452_11840 [Dissulfurispiraceae bacterium]|nr:hypothetical protein [Dissulfurispiraceae bacterium]